MELLVFLVVAFLLMWLLVVIPQRRRQAAHRQLVAGLEPGDEVITAGGIYGDVTEVGEDEVAVEIAPGVEVRVASRAIAAVVPPDVYEDDDQEGVAVEPGSGGDEQAPAAAERPPGADGQGRG